MKKLKKEEDRAKDQAKAQIASIVEMVKALQTDNDDEREEAIQAIQEDPLSVKIRSGWYSPGESGEPEEFQILLYTGGPAVRIIGELGQYNEPDRAWIEYQDWGTPWTTYSLTGAESDALLTYCQRFYFRD